MLCMVCQYGKGDVDGGIDAPAGAYGKFLGTCSPVANSSLPNSVQPRACEIGLDIPKYAYQPFWSGGNWFFKFLKEVAWLQITSGTNSTGVCSVKADSASESRALATTGGALGATIMVLLAALIWCWLKLAELRRENEAYEMVPHSSAPELLFQAQSRPMVSFSPYAAIVPPRSPSPSPPVITQPRPRTKHNPPRPTKLTFPAPPNLQDHAPNTLPAGYSHQARLAGPTSPILRTGETGASWRLEGAGVGGDDRASLLPPSYYRGKGVPGDTGFDAPDGTYGQYLYGCPSPTNRSLPISRQKAVCGQGLNIPSYVYNPFWDDGTWFYKFTKDAALKEITSGQNKTSYCKNINPEHPPSSTSPLTSSSGSNSSSGSSARLNVGAIVAGVIAGVALVFIIGLTIWFIRYRLAREKTVPVVEAPREPGMTFEPYIHRPVAHRYASETSYETPTSLVSYTYPSSSPGGMEPVTPFIPPPPPPPLPSKLAVATSGPPVTRREAEVLSPALSPVSSINSGDSLHIPPSHHSQLPPTYQRW
ncbi:hypothetical protein RhiJN_08529 [Ceratobasidium sp. AG-Ba]|nr:hypothetical protein RhiJN_08529 [Ceratobasidium sp. AG-Ba]